MVVVFTDNGSKDLHLKKDIMKIEKEKDLQVFIVLTPVYEGWPNDKSLLVFDEVAEVKKATFFQQSVEKQKKVIINNPFRYSSLMR